MLVLTRKTRQQIQIGGNITITVLCVKGQSVRVGIEAPPEVRVVRSELVWRTESRTAAEQPAAGEVSPAPAPKLKRSAPGARPQSEMSALVRRALRQGTNSFGVARSHRPRPTRPQRARRQMGALSMGWQS